MLCRLGSSAVSWGSKKQEVVALSTTEAEYIACTAAACQGVWLRRVLHDCGARIEEPTKLWCDNMSAIAIAKNPTHQGRTKHIDVCFHFIWGLVGDGVISMHHCRTEDQLADRFTKPLTIEKHEKLRNLLGVCMLQSRGVWMVIEALDVMDRRRGTAR